MANFIAQSQVEFNQEIVLALDLASKKRGLAFLENSRISNSNAGKSFTASWEIYDEFDGNSRAILISKFQRTSGTTEEKIPFDVIRALEIIASDDRFKKVWIVIGGAGWNQKYLQFIETKLQNWIPQMIGRVLIVVRRNDLLTTDFSDF